MKILHVISSLSGEDSFSIKLGNAIIEKLQGAEAGSSVVTRNLAESPLPHFSRTHMQALYFKQDLNTPESNAVVQLSDEAVDEIQQADAVVIGVPMYNFGIPSSLKSWIDHITRAGKTFSYSEKGPEGLLRGKKVFLAISSGGIYSEGLYKSFDFTETYLKTVLGFMGMNDVEVIRVEGVAIPDLRELALEKSIKSIAI